MQSRRAFGTKLAGMGRPFVPLPPSLPLLRASSGSRSGAPAPRVDVRPLRGGKDLENGLTAFTIFEGFPQPIAGKIVLSPSTNEGSNGDRINSIDRDPLKPMLKFDHLKTRISVYNRDLCCSLHILEKANCQCS